MRQMHTDLRILGLGAFTLMDQQIGWVIQDVSRHLALRRLCSLVVHQLLEPKNSEDA